MPGQQISPTGPEADLPLVIAAKNTLKYKLDAGGGHTGWSAAWATALWARLHNGEHAGNRWVAYTALPYICLTAARLGRRCSIL